MLLKNGKIEKKIKFRGTVISIEMGTPTGEVEIEQWKTSGAYHDMFSSHPNVIVPEHVLGSDELIEQGVESWYQKVKSAAFDADGKPIQVGPRNSILIASIEKLNNIKENAIKRFKATRCCPALPPAPHCSLL